MSGIKYRPDIDGLRAVAVMAVVLHHLLPRLVPGGYVGVDVFFVISGYLITKIISREIEEGTFTFVRFYERRVRRLFPALFAMLAATLVAGWFLLLPSDYLSTFRAALGTVIFSSNVVFWKEMEAGYFAVDAKLNPLLHTWSLAVEEQFYLFFPILLLVCYRYAKRFLVAILIAIALVTLLAASVLLKGHQVAVFFLSPFRAWELLAGVLLALNALPANKSRVVRELVAGSGLVAILAAAFFYDSKTAFPGLAALAPVLGTVAVIHAGSTDRTLVARFLQLRPVVYLGLISYSLYLWHWPLIVLTRFAIGMAPLTPYAPALLVASLSLGSFSYHWIERPFRRPGGISIRRPFAMASATALALIAVCSFGLVRVGFAERFESQALALDESRRPIVPFSECDDSEEWCHLGVKSIKPTILLWGDSHLLAWAPALDRGLISKGKSAVFALRTACPPLVGVESRSMAGCSTASLRVLTFLRAHPSIHTVVMSAHWKVYFGVDSPLYSKDVSLKGESAAIDGLGKTLSWLKSQGRDVHLIGSAPVYDRDVPLTLALEQVQQRRFLAKTFEEHHKDQSKFFNAVHEFSNNSVSVVDPAEWMCRPQCLVEVGGVPLYRDDNHLSVAGALAYSDQLASGLMDSSAVMQPDARPSISSKSDVTP